VRANPPVFSPNGDGINDDTVIEFILSKADTPRNVAIQIFDLKGGVVNDLRVEPLAAGTYLRPQGSGPVQESPGYWDGRDSTGRFVPPGLYIYQVKVDLNTGIEVKSGVVALVY
jgi:hypothetical protein